MGWHFTISRHASPRGGFLFHALRFLGIASVLVRFDHIASLHRKRELQRHVNGTGKPTKPVGSANLRTIPRSS
jgi:hypothetical protein